MFCSNCGKKVEYGNRFCLNCGAPLENTAVNNQGNGRPQNNMNQGYPQRKVPQGNMNASQNNMNRPQGNFPKPDVAYSDAGATDAFYGNFSGVEEKPVKKKGKAGKIIAIILVVVLLISVAGLALLGVGLFFIFSDKGGPASDVATTDAYEYTTDDSEYPWNEEYTESVLLTPEIFIPDAKKISEMKVGLIVLHDESSINDFCFIDDFTAAAENVGLYEDNVRVMTDIAENNECYDAATELAEWGADIIFSTSFGHEDYMLKAAKENPDIVFCAIGGMDAQSAGVSNFFNAFAKISEGHYVNGVAAGLILQDKIDSGEIDSDEAVLGFVAPFTYSECISAYSAFYLGAKSVCEDVTMNVAFTGTWYDMQEEYDRAETLINEYGCLFVGGYSSAFGANFACTDYEIPSSCMLYDYDIEIPYSVVMGFDVDWTYCFEYYMANVSQGNMLDEWCAGIDDEVIGCWGYDEELPYGAWDIICDVDNDFFDGNVKVFDTSAFTVNGKTVKSYYADVLSDPDYEGDTQVIIDGEFLESEFRSYPYFDLEIDGITLVNKMF